MILYEWVRGNRRSRNATSTRKWSTSSREAGDTQLELPTGERQSFEWGATSLFAIPLNAKYRHFNASGLERALLVSTTNLPMILNLFHNERFVFDNNFDFDDRFGKKSISREKASRTSSVRATTRGKRTSSPISKDQASRIFPIAAPAAAA